MINEIWEDIRFFTGRLKSLKISESLDVDGGFCVYTGCKYENWVYYPKRVKSSETVSKILKFFSERDATFMWPVYDDGEEYLKNSGLIYAGDLRAMSFDTKNSAPKPHPDIKIKISPSTSPEIWAETADYAFGGNPEETPESYINFVRSLKNDADNLSLYTAELEGKTAGTFMITNEPELTGVYYFAVIPEMRRRGVANAMMNEICRLSKGKKIVLQSTPSGFKFYSAFGFNDLFGIHVYSTEGDIL